MASNLKQQLFSGVFYTALAKYSGIVISLVVAGVLARLLTPDDFGIVAIATVIIAFFSIFTDMGISPAIVQNKALTEKDLSDIFSFTLWMGAGLSVLFFAASWPIAAYYESPILRTLCQLLCVNLFFASATIVPNALFFKNKEFKFIALRSFAVQVASGTAAVIAALNGAGLYALIISPILSSILLFIISLKRYPQHPAMTLGWGALRKIFSYSAYQFLFNVINYFSRNLDKLLIGKYMGMSELGYYEKSYRLMMLPLQNITQVVTPVMHPIFSDYQNDLNRLASAYERILRLLAFIGIPLSVLLFFTAEEVTLIIFGQQWLPSVPVFRILTLGRRTDHPLLLRKHLPGCRRHAQPVRLRGILVRAQCDGDAARHLLVRHAGSRGMVHRHHVLHQLHPVLLADVPRDAPAKHVDTAAPVHIAHHCRHAHSGRPHPATLLDKQREYFSHVYIEKYRKFHYLWDLYTNHARV